MNPSLKKINHVYKGQGMKSSMQIRFYLLYKLILSSLNCVTFNKTDERQNQCTYSCMKVMKLILFIHFKIFLTCLL